MATHPKRAAGSEGKSPIVDVVIKAISAGRWTHAALAKSLSGYMSGEPLRLFLLKMSDAGLIATRRGGWSVTTKGAEQLRPRVDAPPLVPWRTPAAPPRRPGSNHDHIPSIAAGREYKHRSPI